MTTIQNATSRLATAALVFSLATPFAAAETATSDCDGWTMTGHKVINPDGMRRYLQQNAILQRLVDGDWVDVEHDFHDCLSDATEPVLFEGTWDAELITGEYRAIFHQDIWLGWWTELADAQETAANTPRWFGFDDEVGPYTCEAECAGDADTHGYRYWRCHPDEWPVDELEFGGEVYDKEFLIDYLYSRGCRFSKRATKELIAAKLNFANCSNPDVITNVPFCGATISDTVDYLEGVLFEGENNYHCWMKFKAYIRIAFYNRGWIS